MLEIAINNKKLDIEQKSIKYTKQGNDIGDLSSREANYTNSFKAPKTPNNVQILEGLGLKNDTSNIPYTRNTAQILDNGYPLVTDGWLEVKSTADEFKITVRDGIIDLFKAIDNKSFGDDVDLSEIDHDKTMASIIASFTNQDYRYIINDYGGKTHVGNNINIDYLIPSVRVRYLWNKIFTTFGFSYIGNIFNTFDFDELWLTYPKGIDTSSATVTLYAEMSGWNNSTFATINVIQGSQINNNTYVVPETGNYSIEFSGTANISYPSGRVDNDVPIELVIDGDPSYVTNGTTQTIGLSLDQGSTITFEPIIPDGGGVITSITGSINISKYDSLVSFTEELKQLKIKDFLKEILWLFGLTIFKDIDGNYVFKTFDERLQSDVIDWSDKYVELTNETYTPKTYGQANSFNHKYNDDEDDYNNGNFSVSNENLDEEKAVISSKIYSHEREQVLFKLNSLETETVHPTLLYDKQVTENNGVQEVKYKELSKRFYFLRNETIVVNATLQSEVLPITQSVNSLPVARHLKTTYKDFVPEYYDNIELLINDFRLHNINLALNTIDFINLDFDKIYYFKQEHNYYFLNKETFEKGKVTKAQFYRLKYSESLPATKFVIITDVVNNGGDNYTITFNASEFPVTIETSTDGFTFTGFASSIGSPYTVTLPVGTTHIRISFVNSGITYNSNIWIL